MGVKHKPVLHPTDDALHVCLGCCGENYDEPGFEHPLWRDCTWHSDNGLSKPYSPLWSAWTDAPTNPAPLPDGPWHVIAADPPWQYQKDPGAKGGGDGAGGIAEREYPTMTNEEIAALPVRDVAADDAHLFMWITNPGIYGGRFSDVTPADIAAAWGFEFKTILTWVKTVSGGRIDRGGMGWYFRGATEHVLYATRGKVGIPAALREPNVFLAAKREHSRKPEAFYQMIHRVIPSDPYYGGTGEVRRLEMFARRPQPGWTVWGNEADGDRVLSAPDLDHPKESLW